VTKPAAAVAWRFEGVIGPWLEIVRHDHGLLILTVDNVDACVFVADGMLTCRHDHRVMAMERQRSCSFLPAGEA
jgi:hypothetical protein